MRFTRARLRADGGMRRRDHRRNHRMHRMTAPMDNLPTHKDDFGRVYDLEDPSPYFTALRPADYRMPAVLARTLEAVHQPVARARRAGGALRLLDFACGYGAIGALLRHSVSMADLYAWYGERQWQPADSRRFWPADAAFLESRRSTAPRFEIGGVDIAGTALEYAAAMGFADRVFHEDLVERPPSEALRRFVQGTDLVVESGAVGDLVTTAFERILDCCRESDRPWFIYCPRPDFDWTGLHALWGAHGYRAESLGTAPVRYRKALSVAERADMLRVTRELGRPESSVMRDGYLLVDMTLARPDAEIGNPPIAELRGGYD